MGLRLLAETPVEALVLRHPAIASASPWTWISVLAAVLSLWLIRCAAVPTRTKSHHCSMGDEVVPTHGEPDHDLSETKTVLQTITQQQSDHFSEARCPTIADDDSYGSGFPRKGVVFEWGEEDAEEDSGVMEDEMTVDEEEDGDCSWSEDGGRAGGLLERRWQENLRWYRYQDLASLNGRVVRLWEDEKRMSALPLRRRRHLQAAW